MIPLPLALASALVLIATAFYIGWDISVRRFNTRRASEQAYLRRLESDIEGLAQQLDTDVARTGIDTGKDYVVYRIQATLDDIRSESR